MSQDDWQYCHDGFVLIFTMIVLFVLTCVVVSAIHSTIRNQMMQNNWIQYNLVFQRAQFGLAELIAHFEGKDFQVPTSSIVLNTSYSIVSVDDCGNQTMDLQSVAENEFSTVTLNSRDIFARVPRRKDCNDIPLHQIIWWRET